MILLRTRYDVSFDRDDFRKYPGGSSSSGDSSTPLKKLCWFWNFNDVTEKSTASKKILEGYFDRTSLAFFSQHETKNMFKMENVYKEISILQ